MANDEGLVDLGEDFSEVLMLEICEIFSHHFLLEEWVEVLGDLASDQT